eukprot:7604_1
MAGLHRLHTNISCFAFNGDFTQIALSPNNNKVLIYKVPSIDTPTDKWPTEPAHILEEHDSFVSGVDWSPITNLIVTAAHDRNSYVWRFEDGKWTPTLVILRINRAANCVQWSPDGNKFAVGSAAKVVPVCHYESSNNWWVSKMIKKHKSSVLTVDWHRNSKLLLTGGSDYKCRIFSAFIEEIDSTDDAEEFESIFPKQHDFGVLLMEFDCARGWVESVCWSPSGYRCAYASHDSQLSFVQLVGDGPALTQVIKLDIVPFRSIVFMDENTIVACGHDCNLHVYRNKGEVEPQWEFVSKLDKEAGVEKKVGGGSAFSASRSMFQSKTTRGEESAKDTVLKTKHQNQIVQCRVIKDVDAIESNQLITASMDGRMLKWEL